MRNLVRSVVFLALPIPLVMAYLSPSHPYRVNERRYAERLLGLGAAGEARAVLLGDSHVAAVPQAMLSRGAYNLADGGDGVAEMYGKLWVALRERPGIDLALVSCDYHMFARHKVQSPKRTFLFPFLDRKMAIELYGLDPVQHFLVGLHPVFDEQLYSFERERWKDWVRSIGAQRRVSRTEVRWERRSTGARAKIARGTALQDYAQLFGSTDNERFYRALVALGRRHGVRMVGVRFPVVAEYLTALPMTDRGRIEAVQESLGFERILDYTELLHRAGEFRDPDHVSQRGAKVLVQRLRKDLEVGL